MKMAKLHKHDMAADKPCVCYSLVVVLTD